MGGQFELDVKCLDEKKLGEKFKTINMILKRARNKEYNQSEIEAFLLSYMYTDSPTIFLYVSLVNILKKSDVVVNLLKSENDAVVRRTIKTCAFFFNNDMHMADFYVRDIFPYLFFSHRSRLLNTIAKNLNDEERAQQFFEHFSCKYNSDVARSFLTYCSTVYIMNVLDERQVILTFKGIKTLIRKKPKFVHDYVQKLYGLQGKNVKITELLNSLNHYKLIRIIITDDLVSTLKLIEDNKKWLALHSFGNNLSNRILKDGKAFVLQDPEYFSLILKRAAIYQSLSAQEYKQFYKGLFPKKLSQYHEKESDILPYLDYFKTKEKKLKLHLNTYKDVFGKDLLECDWTLSFEIMKLLDEERRVKYAKMKIEEDGSNISEWTCYLTCDEAIPMLKNEIRISPTPMKRGEYLERMVISCRINDDMPALLAVLKYFNERHRNEDGNIKSFFSYAIADNVDFKKLTREHWEEIKEFLAVMIVNKDHRYMFSLNPLATASIHFNLDQGLSITDPCLTFLKFQNEWCHINMNLFEKENHVYEKKCLLTFGELIPKISPRDRMCASFLDSVVSWNNRNPHDIISILDFSWAVDHIKVVLESGSEEDKQDLLPIFEHDKKAAACFEDELKKIEPRFLVFDLQMMVNLYPNLILKHFKDITGACSTARFIKPFLLPLIKSKKISCIKDFDETMKNFCLKAMGEDCDDQTFKPRAIQILSCYLSADEFYSIVKPLYPEESRVAVGAEDADVRYDIHRSIAYALKNYAGHHETFKALKVFCAGDYLKLTIGSLNSVCSKSAFYKVMEFLKSCVDTPVSFKKHVIRLFGLICDNDFLIDIFKDLWAKEKHYSIRQVLLQNIFEIFVRVRDDVSWTLLKNSVETLSVVDKHSLSFILHFKQIPDKYLSEYIRLTWSTVAVIGEENVYSYKSILIQEIIDLFHLIDGDVIKELLEKIFNPHNNEVSNLDTLACRYILEGSSTEICEERIKFITSKMKTVIEKYSNSSNDNIDLSRRTKSSVSSFINTLCTSTVCNEKYRKASEFMLTKLMSQLELIFDPSLFLYDSYVVIHFSIIFNQSSNLTEFGAQLRPFVDKEIRVNGLYIINHFADILTSFLKNIGQSKVFHVADGLLREPIQSIACVYLVMNVVPLQKVFKPKHRSLLDRLVNTNDRAVKVVLNMNN